MEPTDDLATTGPEPAPRSAWRVTPAAATAVVAGALLLLTLVGLATNAEPVLNPTTEQSPRPNAAPASNYQSPSGDAPPELPVLVPAVPRTPPRLPGIVAIAAALIVALVALAALRDRFRGNTLQSRFLLRTPGDEEPDADHLADLAGKLRERLLSADDPRLAIQQAYASVESGFGVEQLARDPAETPLLYLQRLFGRVGSVQAPLARLTSLFEIARFSTQPITLSMRDEAADALDEIRTIYLDKSTRKRLADQCSL